MNEKIPKFRILKEKFMRVLVVNGNKIEIDLLSLFSGKETVYYNGEIVSQTKSMWGSLHAFNVIENEKEVSYNISVKARWGLPLVKLDIKRNGELIYSDYAKNPRGIQL